jgi:hypothetical protein
MWPCGDIQNHEMNCAQFCTVIVGPVTSRDKDGCIETRPLAIAFSPGYEHCGGKTWFNITNISPVIDAILRKSVSASFRRHPSVSKDYSHGVSESVVIQYFTVKLFALHASIEVDGHSFESAVCDCRLLSIFAYALLPHQEDSCDVVTHLTWTVKHIRKLPSFVKLPGRGDIAS